MSRLELSTLPRPRRPCGRRGWRAVWLHLLLALGLCPRLAQALDTGRSLKQYAHDEWARNDGLPEGTVLAIRQTSDGYLWLGTQTRLVRFDGERFTSFEDGRLGLGQYSFARDLLEAPDKVVWAALVGGVARYQDGKFSFFDQHQGLDHPFVYALAPGPAGSLWVGTGGTGVWQLERGTFARHTAYQNDVDLPGKVNDLATDSHGTLWVATDSGVLALGRSVEHYSIADGLPSAVTSTLLFDKSGTLWAGTRGGLARWGAGRFLGVPAEQGAYSEDVSALLQDKSGSVWVGTRAGALHRLTGDHIDTSKDDNAGARDGILAMAEDRDGALWIGTGRGLERYRDGAFTTIGSGEGLGSDQVLNVLPRRSGGLWVLEGTGELLTYEQGRTRVAAPAGTLSGEGMLGMVETPDGSLWVGGPKLHRFRDGVWQEYTNPGGEFAVLAADGTDLVVAQTSSDGTSTLWRLANGVFTRFAPDVRLTHVQRIYRARNGHFWISTGGRGLVRLTDHASRAWRTADGLPSDIVYGIDEDAAGNLWVATRSGLARIHGDKVTSLAHVQGLPRRSPVHLKLDGLGYLWVSADDGVYRLRVSDLEAAAERRLDEPTAHRFTVADGLRTLEISWRCSALAQTPDGRLWYATRRGLSWVDPARISTQTTPPLVSIEELMVGGRTTELAPALQVREGRERIAFRFTAPGLTNPEQLEFRYRLVGYDADWIDTPTRRTAHYTNVPAGRYRFRVSARRAGGPWGTAGAGLDLWIEPRWYETWLARTCFAAVAVAGLFGLYRIRVRQLRYRERTLKQKVQERTSDLQREVGERGLAEQEVRRLAGQLEARVRERTGQLLAANQALAEDVAERRRTEAALAAEKERLAVTLRSIGDGVITTDVDGQVVLMNRVAEQLTGFAFPQAKGKPLAEVFQALDRTSRTPLQDPVAEVLAARGARSDVLNRAWLVSRTGHEILLDASAAPICDSDSRVFGAVLVFRDVTEKTRSEEQLRKAEKIQAVGVLAGGIAHDFNNLLTGILGHVGLARASLPPDAPACAWLDDSLEGLNNACGLARQLLTFSSGGRPAPEPHSLGVFLQRSARFVLSGSSVSARLEIPDDLWACHVDPLQIRQALDNLVLNARQAMSNGGQLTVSARNVELDETAREGLPPGPYVEVRIADDGPGIAPEVQERVFDLLYTTKPMGTGLGLTTVQSIVQQHGGAVDFVSTLGSGTTFRLLLRAAPAAPPSAAPLRRRIWERVPRRTGRILAMDDEAMIRKLVHTALTQCGYDVELAEDGEDAVVTFERAKTEGRPFDLVILDLTVAGGMGGVETLERLRAIEPKVRALASSGYSSGGALTDPSTFGFIGTLPKPYELAELERTVEAALCSVG